MHQMPPARADRPNARGLASWLLATLLACAVTSQLGCDPAAEDAELVTASQELEIGELSYHGTLDDVPPTGTLHEIDMMAGRITKVPVSWVWAGRKVISGAHTFRVRATCATGALREHCDPAMAISICAGASCSPSTVLVDDDPRSAGGSGEAGYATASLPAPYFERASTTSAAYDIRVFSANRGTSAVSRIEWNSSGTTWNTDFDDPYTGAANGVSGASPGHIGGTLVRVGALQASDGVEVRTLSNGAGNEATRMWLLSPGSATSAWFSEAQSGDGDPRIQVSSALTTRDNYVLLGKDAHTTSRAGTETYVDLVRTPLQEWYEGERLVTMNNGAECSAATCIGSPVVLPPGRYLAYVNVRLPPYQALGQYGSLASLHLASSMDSACLAEPRGQGNDRAFTLVLKRGDRVHAQREVARGLLGLDPSLGNPWHYVMMEIDSNGTDAWSLEVRNNKAIIHPQWKYIRNPSVGELKLATYNVFYKPESETANLAKMKNAADLLGTRGSFSPGSYARSERADQVPWQWEVDAIGLQEIEKTAWATTFRDRLVERTAYPWQMIYATTEIAETGAGNFLYQGPIFADRHVTPRRTGSIEFSEQTLDAAGCTANWYPHYGTSQACSLGYADDVFANHHRRAVPARIADRRLGGAERPVALFNWHLVHEDDYQTERRSMVAEMILRVKGLLAAEPLAFNKEGVNDAKHASNRFVIIGDSNGVNHQCGEFTWWIRRLREEFGYAVDVSTAAVDELGRTWDMHYSGAPITEPFTGSFGNCAAYDWSDPRSRSSSLECPFHFKHRDKWSLDDQTSGSWYPWWQATSRGNPGYVDDYRKPGTRFDTIILVGQGWATDDPVLDYKVMADRSAASPANGMLGGGVEMSLPLETDCSLGLVSSGYAPNLPLYGCGTQAGQPAMMSDHKPVGARLRVYAR